MTTMSNWYIDAIDPRSGFAVTSQRDSDLLQDKFKASGPSAFIAPPNFQPEFVATRSTGFGLSRYRAQTGLFFNGAEISFDSLPAVAEFVRRTYLSGAGGDGPDENGGLLPPPPPPEGGDRPDMPLHQNQGMEVLIQYMRSGWSRLKTEVYLKV